MDNNFIKRYYTTELVDSNKSVFDLFQYKNVDVNIIDHSTGKVIYQKEKLEFPVKYTQSACDIIASKYFKRANVPNSRGYEYSIKQVVHRQVRFWVDAALDEKLINEKEADILYDEMVYMMLDQRFAPNSPQWFNTGLNYYDIKNYTNKTPDWFMDKKSAHSMEQDSDGHFYYDTKLKKVMQSKDKYSRTQASACFILSVEDKLLGPKSISEQYVTETRLFKHGSGTGTNFSNIRAKGEKLSGGGTSSGVLSFLKGFDRNAGTIKSGGTTRRAAKMLQLDADHPEIFEYISWKKQQEDIVRDLIKMGYDSSFDGLAYETVSGQNGNNSVRFSDEFMTKVWAYKTKGEDSDWELKGRIDKSINKTVKVSELWNTFCECAHDCADPAPVFDDTFNAWHTCPGGEDGKISAKYNRINSTNPCGEYAFLDDTACNLASLNLLKYFNEDMIFDTEGFIHSCMLSQVVLEATIHWGQFPVEEVARKTYMFRTTGLGHANIASVLMLLGHPYDSKDATNIAKEITFLMTGSSYYASTIMAQRIGAFEAYDINKNSMLNVITKHISALEEHARKYPTNTSAIIDVWQKALENGKKYGFRNAQVSVIAPTGTIAFAMDCEATSVEPFYGHVVYKKLAGGGSMTIVNPLIERTLIRLGYNESDIESIKKDILEGNLESNTIIKKEHLAIFDTANKSLNGTRFISPMGHVNMIAAITPAITGSISKTVNLPESATVEDISEIYLKAWELGIKGISVYRDGCKSCQPLNISENNDNKSIEFENMSYKDLVKIAYKMKEELNKGPVRNKPEGILNARIHPAIIDNMKLHLKVSFYDNGNLAEFYIDTDKEGTIIKGLLDSMSKLISKMIQYNIPINDIIKTLKGQKYEPHGFVSKHPTIKYVDSISDLIARVLELESNKIINSASPKTNKEELTIKQEIVLNTIEDAPRVYGKVCSSCSSTKLVKNGTCFVCTECGTTTGCS